MEQQREVREESGTAWVCIQAYAGTGGKAAKKAARLAESGSQTVEVVCTPNGGAQSVRLKLKENWLMEMSDSELLSKIKLQAY